MTDKQGRGNPVREGQKENSSGLLPSLRVRVVKTAHR